MENLVLKIWHTAQEVLGTHGDRVDRMDIIHDGDGQDETITIYHGDGYCFELKKEYICDPDEDDINDFENVELDGYCYTFTEPWDGFSEAGVTKALELLKEYAL